MPGDFIVATKVAMIQFLDIDYTTNTKINATIGSTKKSLLMLLVSYDKSRR